MTQSHKQNMFESRERAGEQLGEKLSASLREFKSELGETTPLVIALPPDGLPVAHAVAECIGADLEVAPASFGSSAPNAEFAAVTADSWKAASSTDPRDRLIILVDDGVITGQMALTLSRRLRDAGAAHILVATPVATKSSLKRFDEAKIRYVTLHEAEGFKSLDEFYGDIAPVASHVVETVRKASSRGLTTAAARGDSNRRIDLDLGDFHAEAVIDAPTGAPAAVIVLRGEGADQAQDLSPLIRELGLASLTIDLSGAEKTVASRARLVRRAIVHGASEEAELSGLPIAIVALGENSAAALEAAASVPEHVRCIVSVGGRPDLAKDFLPRVMAPTLLTADESDETLIWKNREAMKQMSCEKALVLTNGAEELGKTLSSWLSRFLMPARPERGSSQPEAREIL